VVSALCSSDGVVFLAIATGIRGIGCEPVHGYAQAEVVGTANKIEMRDQTGESGPFISTHRAWRKELEYDAASEGEVQLTSMYGVVGTSESSIGIICATGSSCK